MEFSARAAGVDIGQRAGLVQAPAVAVPRHGVAAVRGWEYRKVAVNIVDDRGIESLKIVALD